ncbi:N-acetylmuramoyl-L-alanine amidase [Marinilabiliaceae bacterium ANBcel2]|nr:N-acetylmuramoyl-L-alanine amidase [Marinilabiliaceae bacterium ANBcel2]
MVIKRVSYIRQLVLICIGFALFSFIASGEGVDQNRFKTVVIDPGHGGKDPGARGRTVKEKDVVLSIGLKVGEYLKRELSDLNVVFTREEDVFVPLDERAAIANEAKADLFVSIHANSISNPNIYGAETFVLGLHRSAENLEVAKRENSVITLEEDYTTKYEGFDPTSTESYIIFELMQNVYLDQSISAASIIQDQFENRVGRFNRGVKQAGFLVLRKTAMPGVLVEVGFLSNANEEKFLASEMGQVYIASAIFRAIREYKFNYDDRNHIAGRPSRDKDLTPGDVQVDDLFDEDQVQFRIQVASSGMLIDDGTGPFELFDDVWVYEEGDLYRYTTGLAGSYEDIQESLSDVREKIPGSFIVAFKNGERIPVESAREINN